MTSPRKATRYKRGPKYPVFVDLFSGCGGLTLGLLKAGWRGSLGIEHHPDAFHTYRANFVDSDALAWPDWLDPRAWDIRQVLKQYKSELRELRGEIDLVCGGPPCQGFSLYGRRDPRDCRNQLFRCYIDFIKLVQPKIVLLENVPGFGVAHGKEARAGRIGSHKGRIAKTFAKKLRELLERKYKLDDCLIRSSDFGVPQVRDRFFAVGVRRDLPFQGTAGWAKELMEQIRTPFLKSQQLPPDEVTTARTALADLEVASNKLIDYRRDTSCNSKRGFGFQQIKYRAPRKLNKYLKLMRSGLNGEAPNSLRLPRHTPSIQKRNKEILKKYPNGRQLNDYEREKLGITKMRIVPLAPDRPAQTITTLPDDLLHYSEPRILTVRECARLQSFPDWFEFHGKYTTGGESRAKDCPRYTQVGNAVPPLVAEAWGMAMLELI